MEGQIIEYEEAFQQIECASLASVITRENIDEVFSLTVTNEIGAKTILTKSKEANTLHSLSTLFEMGILMKPMQTT